MNEVPNILYLAIFLLIFALLILVLILIRVRKKLIEKEIRLSTVFESQPECIKLQDEEGVVLEMNQAGLCLLEVDNSSDVIGKTVYEFISSEHHSEYRKLTKNVFAGYNQIMEFKINGKKGAERWLETNAVPLRDQGQNIIALLASTRDVTERKNLERKLQKRQMELDHVCKVSTMGEVASGIAHELNQPLCAISSYAETCSTLLNFKDTTSLKETLLLISEQAQRASQIVSWIRGLACKRDINLTDLNIGELLTDVKTMSKYILEQHKVELSIEMEKALPDAIGDRVQLEHVFINLIKNAAEAMSRDLRKRKITIKAYQDLDGNILLSVKDNGTGIPKENESKVLNPYFTTKRDGLGMGLSICRSIINAHKGRLWVEQSNEHGTEFIISLNPSVRVQNAQYA
ncbi:MAG: ATP-binding protein [Gammaproteobacteria bacterium]